MSAEGVPPPLRSAVSGDDERGFGGRLFSLLWPPIAFFVILMLAWKLALSQGWISDLILPQPEEVAVSFVELVADGLIWEHVWATSYETLAGFIVAALLGIGLAVLCGLWELPRRALYPYIITLQVTPRIAIAPILIAWLGFGYSPKIVLAATIAFFPIFINALTGIISVDRDSREMFESLGASRWQTFRHLMVPSAMPVTFAGLKVGMTLALIGAVVGEFISADKGLGLLVQRFSSALNMSDALAIVLVLTVVGLILYAAMEWADRALVFWSHEKRLAAKRERKTSRVKRKYGETLAGLAAGQSQGEPRAALAGGPARNDRRER